MLSSLLVVVIVGVVVALVTRWSLAETQPATTAARAHRAHGDDPPNGVAPASAPTAVRSPEPAAASPRAADLPPPTDPGADALEAVRIPWWRRLRAALGLGVFVAVLGTGLALVLAASAFALVAVLDRALG